MEALNKDLLIAARSGDLKAVERSLENGANVNCKDNNKNTPLHWAAHGGFIDVAELLISKGADIQSQGYRKNTPLHIASEGGFIDVASLLISKGADIHGQDRRKNTPLHYAARGGFIDVAELLISKGADIQSQGYGKNTPLHIAARGGFIDVAELLISKGADIHSQDWRKNSPLHIASEGGFIDVASLLISKGADIHSHGYGKNTPLHYAATGGFIDLASLMILKGADIQRQCCMGYTPLHKASQGGFVDVAELLISKGADIHSKNWWKYTPLHYASEGGFVDVASLLISKGADIHSQNYRKNTPLHMAADGGFIDVAELLISKGADIHSQDDEKNTPLHKASEGGFVDVASLLISKGADINSQNYRRQTALNVAEGKVKILLQLVESGVNVNHALKAAKQCDSLTEAQEYIQSPPLAASTVPINMPLDGGVQQPDQDIILPGIVDAKEFKSLLKLGTYESFGNRIYLAGACSVGKSTLACLLIGDDIPLEWKSTDGLKIFFGRNGIHLEERKMVPLDKRNTNILSSVLRGQPDRDTSQQDMQQSQHHMEKSKLEEGFSLSNSDNNGACQQKPSPASTGIESAQGEPLAAHSSISDVSEKQETISGKINTQEKKKPIQKRIGFNLIHEGIKEEIKKGEYKVRIAPSDLVDFGGQKSYDMTHQLFIQGKGTFTLMFDGRKGLRDPLPEYPQGDLTTESMLKHWVDSILTYCGEDDDDILPVILFVATHRDELTEDQQFDRMTEFKNGLKDMLLNQDHNQRIKYDDIFFINGTDENDPEVKRLMTTYVEIAFKQKSWGKRMPMAWVPLELQMSEMRANNICIISKDDLVEINEGNDDLALTDRQLDEFLRVQHSMGKIMYFEGQGLEKYIIIQPITLVDILRSFITDEMFWPSDRNLKEILKVMTETGKIRKVDLFKLWSQDEFNHHIPCKEMKEFVAQILSYLDLLVEPKRKNTPERTVDFYLVPCMIKRQISVMVNNLDKDKTICLSYKLLKSSIPSALSFKLIGAVMNVWPLKETNEGVCLYHKAAVLCIDKSNELHLLVKEDSIVVYLVNEVSKCFISPDIASCAQECLTLALTTALEFYHNSFGKLVPKSKIADLFEIEVGEKCGINTCYISLREAQRNPTWICKLEKEHKAKCLLYWTYNKEYTGCHSDCTGLDESCFKNCPKDKDLARLALYLGITSFPDFFIKLGLTRNDWEFLEYKHNRGDVNMMKIDALCEWKKKMDNPSFKDLDLAITDISDNNHLLCRIFREDRSILDIDNPRLQTVPDDATLYELSRKIGNCAIHLGIELDIDMSDIEETITRYNKDMFDQNYDILLKWKKKCSQNTGTIRTLMHVLKVVDNRGCKFLKDKFKI